MAPGRKKLCAHCIAGALGLLLAQAAPGQETIVSLSGHVRDASGGAIAGAAVTITDPQRGATRSVSTDSRGFYRLMGLEPGRYTVSAAFAGFETRESTATLGVGQDTSLEFVLPVKSLSSSAEVVAYSAPASPALGARVDGGTLRSMPLNGRDLAQLVLLQPGVTWTRSSLPSNTTGRGTRFSVGGAGPAQNAFVVDGTLINDALGYTPGSAQGLLFGVDSVEEFRVLTGVIGAEYSRGAGGVFLAVTRSGTNAWKGSAFEFFRNDALDSPTFFDQEKPDFDRNQFGASLGGPIRTNRTFFFATYEGLRQNKGITRTALVPDLNARRGIVGGVNVGVDPRAAPLLALYPAPNGPEVGGGAAQYVSVLDQDSVADVATARVDHRFSGMGAIFVRYNFENSHQVAPRLYAELPNLTTNRKHLIATEGRIGLPGGGLGFLRLGVSKTEPEEDPVFVQTTQQIVAGQPFGELNVPGLSDFGTDRGAPAHFGMTDLSGSLNVTQPRGDHLLKAGLSVEQFRIDGLWEGRTRGQLRFRSVSDLLRFSVLDLQAASADSDFARRYNQWSWGAFLQDEWRVNSRLKLDLGLRWEYVTGPAEQDGKGANLKEPSDPQTTVGNPLFTTPPYNLAPRVGVVWDVSGNGRTMVRSGFGVFYDPPLFSAYRATGFRSLPFANRGRLVGGAVSSLPVPPERFAGVERSNDSIDSDINRIYYMKWGLEIAHGFSHGFAGSLTYSGSSGNGLLSIADVNTAVPIVLPDGSDFFPQGGARRNPAFDVSRRILDGYSSLFNALGVSVSRASSHGPSFNMNYRLGKATDNVAGFGNVSSSNGQTRALDPYRPELDQGPSNFDVRHSFSFTASQHLPWSLAVDATFQYASGEPFTPVVEGDPDRDGSDQNPAKPDLVPGVPLYPTAGSTDQMWFNLAAFASPTPGRRGNAPRNLLRSPAFATLDASLSRRISLGRTRQLDLRLEAFNLTNRVNLAQPANAEGGEVVLTYVPPVGNAPATFTVPGGVGRIFSIIGTARELQLGARFSF